MVGTEGLEPPTERVWAACANRLRHVPYAVSGGEKDRVRCGRGGLERPAREKKATESPRELLTLVALRIEPEIVKWQEDFPCWWDLRGSNPRPSH